MELIKKQIHMNQFKGTVTTQITLDDDFIVPDTMDDMAQVMLDTGEIPKLLPTFGQTFDLDKLFP